MEKDILGDKIKALRNSKGYSQEYLSELAQLSLRTVQRIENGETGARGDTLSRLATALGVAIDVLITDAADTPVTNDGYLAAMNLAGIGCLFVYIPFLGFVLPLILWLMKKDKMPDVREQGKKILNFQLTYVILFVAWFVFVIFIASRVMYTLSPGMALGMPEMILLSFVILPVFNVVMVIINTIRVLQHKQMRYWPAFRFLR